MWYSWAYPPGKGKLMPDRKELILQRLADEGARTAAFFGGLPADGPQWQQQVYLTGPLWRVRDVLAHFVSAERTFAHFGRDILGGGPGAPDDFVIDEFNATQVAGLRDVPTADLMAQFEAARADVVGIVQGMTDADFDRIGRHPWFGRAPLANMLKLIYRHNIIHQRDIAKALETSRPVPHVDAQPPGGPPMSSRTETIRKTILADHAASMTIFNGLTAEQW
ncbi:MAG: maleylpyruvate isomerase N-terminal domain-containing protein, partial [Chloroflexi bacterium]|nr:maleylpyruvate isomerase N-terminal domain-containing protein [Chloroflexota bacterium]